MLTGEDHQNSRPKNEPEPVESLATIIPRLLALRGLIPLANVRNPGSSDETVRPSGSNRSVTGGRAI